MLKPTTSDMMHPTHVLSPVGSPAFVVNATETLAMELGRFWYLHFCTTNPERDRRHGGRASMMAHCSLGEGGG